MNKLLIAIATISLMLISLSFLPSAVEWEGIGIIRVFGTAIFTIVIIYGAWKERSLIMYSASFSLIFILLALGFKSIGLPGHNVLLTAGILIFSLIFLPIAAWWFYKRMHIIKSAD